MHLLALALASIVSLATGELPAGAGAPPPPPGGRDYDSPPPGASPEDAALWRDAYDVNNRIIVERGAATRLQASAVAGGYEQRLELLAKRGHEQAERAEDLKKGLYGAWEENASLLTRQWPVDPTRACRNQLLTFEGALYASGSSASKGQLGGARQEVRECVDKAKLPLGALTRSNERLRGVLAQLDRELPPLAPAAPATSGASQATGGGSAR